MPDLASQAAGLAAAPARLKLRLGQVITVLTVAGLRGPVEAKTFYEYVKHLRRVGLPHRPGTFRSGPRPTYDFFDIVEVAVALSLRSYGVLPDRVLFALIAQRERLLALYQRAWIDHAVSRDTPEIFQSATGPVPIPRGPYLKLHLRPHGESATATDVPELLDAQGALALFGRVLTVQDQPAMLQLGLLFDRLCDGVETLGLSAEAPRPSAGRAG